MLCHNMSDDLFMMVQCSNTIVYCEMDLSQVMIRDSKLYLSKLLLLAISDTSLIQA